MYLGKLHTDCWPAWVLFSIFLVAGFILIYLNYNTIEGFAIPSISDMIKQLQSQQEKNKGLSGYPNFLAYVFQNPQTSDRALNDMKQRLFSADCKFQYNWDKNRDGLTYGADTPDKAREAYMTWMRCLADGNSKCYDQVNDAQRRFMAPGCSAEVKDSNVLRDTSNISMLFM